MCLFGRRLFRNDPGMKALLRPLLELLKAFSNISSLFDLDISADSDKRALDPWAYFRLPVFGIQASREFPPGPRNLHKPFTAV